MAIRVLLKPKPVKLTQALKGVAPVAVLKRKAQPDWHPNNRANLVP